MTAYTQLTKLMNDNPGLVFKNDGYEKLPESVVEAHRDAIKSIEDILRQCVKGFVSFQNFKPRKDGSTAVRYQVRYDDEGRFTGVAYTDLREFKDHRIITRS